MAMRSFPMPRSARQVPRWADSLRSVPYSLASAGPPRPLPSAVTGGLPDLTVGKGKLRAHSSLGLNLPPRGRAAPETASSLALFPAWVAGGRIGAQPARIMDAPL